jgi:hypothetical protein
MKFCIVYRIGGSENCTWHRSLAMSKDEAIKAQAETERMGYKALVAPYRLSVELGLPEGWKYDHA